MYLNFLKIEISLFVTDKYINIYFEWESCSSWMIYVYILGVLSAPVHKVTTFTGGCQNLLYQMQSTQSKLSSHVHGNNCISDAITVGLSFLIKNVYVACFPLEKEIIS